VLKNKSKSNIVEENKIEKLFYGEWYIVKSFIGIKNTENHFVYNYSSRKNIEIRQDSILLQFNKDGIFLVNRKPCAKWKFDNRKKLLCINGRNNPKVFFDIKSNYRIEFIKKNYCLMINEFNKNKTIVSITYNLVKPTNALSPNHRM